MSPKTIQEIDDDLKQIENIKDALNKQREKIHSEIDNGKLEIAEKIIKEEIEKNGYCLEQVVIKRLVATYDVGLCCAERHIKKLTKEICITNNYNRIRGDKIIKHKYNIECAGYPALIVKD
jgi:hypothetical protein